MKILPRKDSLRISLNATPEQVQKLVELQAAFAQLCNALAPTVQQTRNWNRVTLHHLAYRSLRQQFPSIGSQMVCNAIYAVSRTARQVFQNPASPFHLSRLGDRPLPLMQFADNNPVYFDRHTLSLKAGVLSLFTLDGRMRLKIALRPADEAQFHERKLREVILSRRKDQSFELSLSFMAEDQPLDETEAVRVPRAGQNKGQLPDYVKVEAVQ
ncbi:MAG: hypothetical protein Q8R63_05710 [Ramlibacter sp.]|nr:hypothetical protein [Ramlibacter sp.]